MTIGERIAYCRTQKNLSMAELAERIGSTSSAVHKWEHGITGSIRVDKLVAIAKTLDTTPEYLMGYVDDPHEKLGPVKMSQEEEELLRIFRRLDLKGRHKILDLAWELEQ